MKTKIVLRVVSVVMLLIAIVFVIMAVSCPTMGRVVYIGSFRFGGEQLEICYATYLIIMFGLFLASFFIKKR